MPRTPIPCSIGHPHRSLAASLVLVLLLGVLRPPMAPAGTVLGPWTPLFQGIDQATGSNTPSGGGLPNLQVVHAVRVDLTDPDVRLFASPRLENYVPNSAETAGLTVSDFLVEHRLQLAINVNGFDPNEYYLPAGTPMNIRGLLISEGTVVSDQIDSDYAASIVFDAANLASIIPTNWPPRHAASTYTAVSGDYAILINGVNVGYQYQNSREMIHRTNPRTAFGLSRDRHTLYLLAIDGRQPGQSSGALDWETAAWMLLLGAHDAINMDGGGSTTLVAADPTGQPVRLNDSSAVADSGRERTVGAHFGIYAKPVRGFLNDIAATPDDTFATITWTTLEPATTQAEFGPTRDLGSATARSGLLSTNHSVVLTGLDPDTTYYFAALSEAAGTTHRSAILALTTTNYVTTNLVFDVTQPWKFVPGRPAGTGWTSPGFDDSAWEGPGPGLLWADVRQTGPNPLVQPKNTQLPASPANAGYPYIAYSFRTRFQLPDAVPGSALRLSVWVDDGAAFFLNGTEVYRLNLPEAPDPIDESTLATGYTFAGDATGPVEITLTGPAVASLVAGDNVLAVSVHNYNARSPDTTFGARLVHARPNPPATPLRLAAAGASLTLAWDRPGQALQQADTATGPWTDVPGPVTTSPYLTTATTAARFFRLRR